jgi:hypothetical protein
MAALLSTQDYRENLDVGSIEQHLDIFPFLLIRVLKVESANFPSGNQRFLTKTFTQTLCILNIAIQIFLDQFYKDQGTLKFFFWCF